MRVQRIINTIENIELVIKIPEAIRTILINCIQLTPDQKSMCEAYVSQAIINGKPLPKSHGDLIDVNELEECKEIMDTINRESKYAVRMDFVRDVVSTIIPADKTESE